MPKLPRKRKKAFIKTLGHSSYWTAQICADVAELPGFPKVIKRGREIIKHPHELLWLSLGQGRGDRVIQWW